MLTYRVVSDRYFETVGAELVEGQAFSTGDRPDGAAVAVVNEAAAAAAARGAIHQPPRAGDDDLQAVEGVRQRVTTVASLGHDPRAGSVPSRGGEGTTLQSIAAVMGMRLFIAPAEPGGMEAPPLPAELTRALDLPSDASVVDAVEAIDQDAVASTLRKGMRLVLEMTELATAAAELLPQVAVGSTTRMIPFAEHVRFEADTGEVAFEESSDLSIAVAERVLPSWARAARLTCVRTAGDSIALTPPLPTGWCEETL